MLVLLLRANYQNLLYAIAACPLVLLVLGYFILPPAKRTLRVWFDPAVLKVEGEQLPPEPGRSAGRLGGRFLTYRYFKQWHEFRIVIIRSYLLVLSGLIAAGLLWFGWWVRDLPPTGDNHLFNTGFICLFVIWPPARWFWERRMLSLYGVSMGRFSAKEYRRARGLLRFEIWYNFVDHNRDYRSRVLLDSLDSDPDNTMTIIFFDDKDSDRSFPAPGLIFHKVVWKEQPIPRAEAASQAAAKGGSKR
jgi:hypothetical protein